MSTHYPSRARRGLSTIGPRQRICGPDELVAAIPYLLGFHPLRSLVLVGLSNGVLVVTARLDLVDAQRCDPVHDTVRALARAGATEIVAVVFEPAPGDRQADVVEAVTPAADAAGCHVQDIVAVSGRRWRSVICSDPSCCPPEGSPVDGRTTSFAAAATLAGVAPAPDRAALVDSLSPYPSAADDPITALITAAGKVRDHAVAGSGRGRHDRAEGRAILRHARAASARPWTGVDDEQAARYAVALAQITVRDQVWMAVDAGRVDGRELWQELSRRLPDPYAAAPLFLFGWASWRAGEGALASIAAERAVGSDPRYSAAQLLLTALASGIDPYRFPRLEVPTSA